MTTHTRTKLDLSELNLGRRGGEWWQRIARNGSLVIISGKCEGRKKIRREIWK